MNIKVSRAEGAVLSWMVAMCEGANQASFKVHLKYGVPLPEYSTQWSQGGPIIEREGIDVVNAERLGYDYRWMAESGTARATGTTALIAAMRCYVAGKLGDEVDVPEELL